MRNIGLTLGLKMGLKTILVPDYFAPSISNFFQSALTIRWVSFLRYTGSLSYFFAFISFFLPFCAIYCFFLDHTDRTFVFDHANHTRSNITLEHSSSTDWSILSDFADTLYNQSVALGSQGDDNVSVVGFYINSNS